LFPPIGNGHELIDGQVAAVQFDHGGNHNPGVLHDGSGRGFSTRTLVENSCEEPS
jgi:hypothetical protein